VSGGVRSLREDPVAGAGGRGDGSFYGCSYSWLLVRGERVSDIVSASKSLV